MLSSIMSLYRVFVSDMVVDLSEPFSGCGNFNNQKIFWHLTPAGPLVNDFGVSPFCSLSALLTSLLVL